MTAYHPKASMIGATSVSMPIVLKPMPTGKLSPAQANLAASRFPFAFYQYLTPRHEVELAQKMLVEMRARDAKNGHRRRLPPTEHMSGTHLGPVEYDGITYDSTTAAAKANDISYDMMRNRIIRARQEIGAGLTPTYQARHINPPPQPPEPKGKRERRDARKPIKHDGVMYPSREALAEHIGRAPQYISKLIRQGKIG
jgi:hypothetical protein